MSKNQTTENTPKPAKKRRSLWWLWLILILAAFAGGVIAGLKLNTMPLPTEVKEKIYPVLESYIPGGTTPRTPEPAPEETPAPTAAPEVTPAPTAEPETTPVPAAVAAPEVTPAPVETVTPEAVPAPAETPAPEVIPEPVETPVPAWMTEVARTVNEAPAVEAVPAPAPKYIGVDAALQIALEHAKLSQNDVEVSGVYRAKNEDGEAVYEVSFRAGEPAYNYTIDAFSGEILSWKMSGLTYADNATFAASFTGNDQTEAEAAAAAPEMIGEERAKEIAFAHAGVKEADVLKSDVQLDQTSEPANYKVEFRIAERRFDYQIDAFTGDILSFELR